MRTLIAVAVSSAIVTFASPLAAQAPVTIDSGMTREQVVAKLGEPLSSRTYDGHTYLLYKNGCEKKCGMNDLVVLDSGKVVDAVFRSRTRQYSGTSSSPRMMTAADARRANPSEGGPPLKVPADPKKKPDAPTEDGRAAPR